MPTARLPRLLAAAGLLALLAGCAASPAPGPDTPPAVDPGIGAEPTAVGLVNLWRVSGAEGEQPETWLRLDGGELQLWRECGMVMGSWRASETLFIASVYGASGDCAAAGLPAVPWLDAAASYRASAGGWELVGTGGEVLAALSVDGAPDAIPTAADFYTRPPEVTDAVREALAPSAPLPAGLGAPDVGELLGTWVPAGFAGATDPHVLFAEDGSWSGSDGCNGGSGRWAADAQGGFLATSGVSTLIGCDGAAVPSWVAQAGTVGFDGEQLVLLDAAGSEIGRLQRG